jgi:hypothetical protein
MTTAIVSPGLAHVTLRRMASDAPGYTVMALLLAFWLMPLLAAMSVDARVFQGESPWLKPVKFHLALSVYAITLAFFARYSRRNGRPWRWFTAAVLFAILGEVLWISSAAMLNTASHFNTEIPVFTVVYPLMGVLAILLTAAALVMGVLILQNPNTGLDPALKTAVVLGLILTTVLTVPVALHLSRLGGHFIGSSTQELWGMGWSRDAGDLRVAHFLATHALHFIPLAGLLAVRLVPAQALRLVWLSAGLYAALVWFTFFQALRGQPFLPLLG